MSTDTTKHLIFLGESQFDLFCHEKKSIYESLISLSKDIIIKQ